MDPTATGDARGADEAVAKSAAARLEREDAAGCGWPWALRWRLPALTRLVPDGGRGRRPAPPSRWRPRPGPVVTVRDRDLMPPDGRHVEPIALVRINFRG
ncbi:hypothetical protein GCM10022420_010370 [Streptomyces iranensis]